MSEHADTAGNHPLLEERAEFRAALDALVAENQRLRDALGEIAAVSDERADDPLYTREIARAALDGTPCGRVPQ